MSDPIPALRTDQRLSDKLDGLEAVVRCRLHGRVRDVRLEVRPEGLILQGSAPTYYAKQLAQHMVMEMTDRQILFNGIEVR